jgi:two-component system nitrate/nitrite sensor histidine kinase NarX
MRKGSAAGFFIPGKSANHTQRSDQLSIFCLPHPYEKDQVGLLCLFFPPDASFSASQITLLNEIALETDLAIERAQMKRRLSSQDAVKKFEHDRIARYLHDTLGHNLAFLRLKLDQLSGDEALLDIVAIQQEIERMRDIADLAYEQMRNSLSDLRGEPVPEFVAAVRECAAAAGERAGFEVRLQADGQSRALPAELQRQILYILREALRNIEKHARASKVWIRIVWGIGNLMLFIRDDGRGFNVDAAAMQPGHFGLKIIRECTEELNGSFLITSKVNSGTVIDLCFPLEQPVHMEMNP